MFKSHSYVHGPFTELGKSFCILEGSSRGLAHAPSDLNIFKSATVMLLLLILSHILFQPAKYLQNWAKAPVFSRAVLEAWRMHHPDWDIRALDAVAGTWDGIRVLCQGSMIRVFFSTLGSCVDLSGDGRIPRYLHTHIHKHTHTHTPLHTHPPTYPTPGPPPLPHLPPPC
ncbi:hypothetical protein T492DRAFT_1037904 [Pavlovales sp. CCMP2436]|nr:hypothetical protein T492DRAFT_1037904 [Pavlovales sp. CCMP2436]